MEQTFALIKPRAFHENLTGPILNLFNTAGFKIGAIKSWWLSDREARQLYGIHQGKPFYEDLLTYMISGPIVVMVLEKDHAVADLRKLVGNTDPQKAEAGTVRKLFGLNARQNAVHASDSPENAEKESALFFAQMEKYEPRGISFGKVHRKEES
mgnify:CR=1 FL=1